MGFVVTHLKGLDTTEGQGSLIVTVDNCFKPYHYLSPLLLGVFPVLLDGRNAITDVDQIVSHLRIKVCVCVCVCVRVCVCVCVSTCVLSF